MTPEIQSFLTNGLIYGVFIGATCSMISYSIRKAISLINQAINS